MAAMAFGPPPGTRSPNGRDTSSNVACGTSSSGVLGAHRVAVLPDGDGVEPGLEPEALEDRDGADQLECGEPRVDHYRDPPLTQFLSCHQFVSFPEAGVSASRTSKLNIIPLSVCSAMW